MDVHCSACEEPWSVHHLWYDAIWETALSEPEIRVWEALPQHEKLVSPWREQFAASGWQFGRTVLNIIRCPCCPKEAQVDAAKAEMKAAIEELLGNDQDAIAVTFADHGL